MIDRELQLDLLKRLAAEYPRTVSTSSWLHENAATNANLHYLSDHDLIDGKVSNELGGSVSFVTARINARGLDFLADDGGLSAILGVVTVKIHEDTIRQLLLDRVAAADIPPEERATLSQSIRSLPRKAIGKLSEKLMENGAEKLILELPRLYSLLSQIV